MDDLVQWLRAQLDEDERTARAVQWDGSGNRLSWELAASATIDVGEDEFYAGDRTIANHIMAHDPARVLREIDAKRRTLTRCQEAMSAANPMLVHFAQQTAREMALPYVGRSGYLEEWRP